MGLILWNVLTPKFYLALTASSFFISILILLFEWWYFAKYRISFIEHILMNIINPIFGINNNSTIVNKSTTTFNGDTSSSYDDNDHPNHQHQTIDNRHLIQGHISLDSKIWRNPMSLFRFEYNLLKQVNNKREPLTFYDINLSAQDHQTFFTCDDDHNFKDMEIMLTAWRERDPETRIQAAHKALKLNPDCAPALILLAEEESKTVWEAEKIFIQALRAAELQYRQSSTQSSPSTTTNHYHSLIDVKNRRNLNVLIYVRRRLAMCARKLGKLRESIKMMRDLINSSVPLLNLFNIHENLIEALLEMQAYADVQALLAKYDDINLPKSATICYTSALLKSRHAILQYNSNSIGIGEKFSSNNVMKRGLSMAEMNAVEAIHRAVEFNPHVPKYLLELKKLIFPPEHILKRGDSEAIAYSFFHLKHWKRIDGALNLLDCTWKGTFRIIPFPLEKGHLFHPYLTCTECTDRELLPDYHEVSVYPKKSIPFFLRFTASLCGLTAIMTFIFYQYPVQIIHIVQSYMNWLNELSTTIMNQLEFIVPNWAYQCYLTKNCWQ